MLDLSTEFKNEMFNDNRDFLPFLDITLADGTVLNLKKKDVWQNSFKVEDATSSSNTLTIGAAVTGKLSATLNNIYDTFSEYDFADAEVIAYTGLQLSDSLEKVRVGTYTIDEPSYDGSTISLSCLDGMSKFDKPYSKSTLKYPAKLGVILADACTCCGVSLVSANFPNKDYVVQSRPTDDALTFGDIVAMVAQIAGCWAKMDVYGRLKLGWYEMSVFEHNNSLDGGTFSTENTPYSDGDTADGGNFTDYSSGDSVDGGTFADQAKFHHVYSTKTFNISTDDVVITGVRVTEEFEETETEKRGTYLAGEDGYVIDVSGNALIQKGQAKTVANYLYGRVGGMRFRPLSVETLANPSIEAGDVAYVTDRKQNTYQTFISNRTFTLGGNESIVCDAETPSRNNATRFSEMTKAIVKARSETKKQISAYDMAVQQLTNLMTQSFGIFKSEEVLEDGSVIYYMHDKPERANSSTIWKMTADAFAVSTDGGKTWNAGFDSSGNAVVNVLNAIGINADWINAGTLTGRKINNGNGTFSVDDNGNCTANSFNSANANITGGRFNVKTDSISGDSRILLANGNYQNASSCSWLCITAEGGVEEMIHAVISSHGFGNCIVDCTGMYIKGTDGYWTQVTNDGLFTEGSLNVSGEKTRVVGTLDYDFRKLYCYETPSPMFGDVGEGKIDDTGKCMVFIDDVFAETVDTDCQYQVFLQPYGDGSVYVSERTPSYFIVCGTRNMRFGWEIKAIQREYDTLRLEKFEKEQVEENSDTIGETYCYLEKLLYNPESEDF